MRIDTIGSKIATTRSQVHGSVSATARGHHDIALESDGSDTVNEHVVLARCEIVKRHAPARSVSRDSVSDRSEIRRTCAA